jgi:hypothetical protein
MTAINKAKKNGYLTMIVNVVISKKEAKKRAYERYTLGENRRRVDNSVIDNIYEKTLLNC